MGKLIKVLLVLASFGCAAAIGIWYFKPDSVVAQYADGPIRAAWGGVRSVMEKVRAARASAKTSEPAADSPRTAEPVPEPVPAAEPVAAEPVPAKTVKASAKTEGWVGLEAENWYAGRKLSARDLRGKVVLVYEFSEESQDSVDLLPRIEQAWTGFRHQPFVVLGSHRGGRSGEVKKLVKAAGVTFSVYEGAGFANEPRTIRYPFLYVVDAAGKVVYRGRSDCDATEAFVTAFSSVGR